MKKYFLLILFCFFIVWCSKETPPEVIVATGTTHTVQAHSGELIQSGTVIEKPATNTGKTQETIPQIPLSQELKNPNISQIQSKNWYDFISDSSYQKFVNNEVSFTQKSYVPNDLEKISGEFIVDTKGNQTLRSEAQKNLTALSQAFYENFWEKLVVVSAYRSYEYQVGIKKRWCSDLYCAKAWFSEHQSGLAFDMFEASSQDEFLAQKHLKKYFEWMQQNAHLYGFHNTYQKGKNIDWYAIEPWHWRYLGVDLATELKNEGKTFAEYVKN